MACAIGTPISSPTETTSERYDESNTYSIDGMEFLEQLLLQGVSRHSDYKDIVHGIDFLLSIADDSEKVEKLFSKIEALSSTGRCINQDAIYLCLVICYVHSKHFGKAEMEANVNKFCRIPTQLCVMVKMLKEYLDRGATQDKPCNTVEYYKAILDGRGGIERKPVKKNAKAAKTKQKPNGSSDKISSKKPDETRVEPIRGDPDAKPNENPEEKAAEKIGEKLEEKPVEKPSEEHEEKPYDCAPQGKNFKTFISKQSFISKWFSDPKKKASDLLLLLTKYQKREGWDTKDLIFYSHPKFNEEDDEFCEKDIVMKYVSKDGFKKIKKHYDAFEAGGCVGTEVQSRIYQFIKLLEAIKEKVKTKGNHAEEISQLIRENKRYQDQNRTCSIATTFRSLSTEEECKMSRLHLTIEHLPSSMYKEKVVFDELIKDMPMTALLRHISHMSYLGLFDEEDGMIDEQGEKLMSPMKIVEEAFTNPYRIFPFVHPFQILKALVAYQKGNSGSNEKEWEVKPAICNILTDAFFLSLQRDLPLKDQCLSYDNCLVCIDDSKSMHQHGFLGNAMLSAAMASVALATAIERLGSNISVMICGPTPVKLEKRELLDRLQFGGGSNEKEKSNLAAPIREAITAGSNLSAVIVFTKSIAEHLCGESVYDAFVELRTKMAYGPNTGTKLVVVSMGANGKVVGDLSDPNVHMVFGGDADVLHKIHEPEQ